MSTNPTNTGYYREETAPERADHVTIIKEGRSGMGGWVVALLAILALAAIAFFAFGQNRETSSVDAAISDASQKVGAAAEKVGAAADKAADSVQ